MVLTGVIVNSATVLIGGLLGLLFKKGLPEKVNQTLMAGLGLCVLYVGISGSLKSENILITVLSISIGAVIGEWIDFDRRLNHLGKLLQDKFSKNGQQDKFAEGFVNSTLFVCVGAMAIVGAIESGMRGNFETYYAKALIDGVVVFIMATAMGSGCLFSAFALFAYQALLTLSASAIAGFLTDTVINEMSGVGALLIVGIALNMLKVTKIKVGNFILAPFIPILICRFM